MTDLSASVLAVSACSQPLQGWTGFSLNGSITLGDIATILTNVAIAFILQHYLASRSEVKKVENGILAEHVRDVFAAIRECQLKFLGCIGKKPTKDEASTIVVSVERISSALAELGSAIEFSHCNDLQKECEPIISSYLQYKRALTGNSFPNRKLTALEQGESQEMQHRMMRGLHSVLFQIGKHR